MRFLSLPVISLILFFSTGMAFAHGVEYELIEGGVGIEARYDSGQPISFSDCRVFSPRDAKMPYQQGLTDQYGRFVFVPDTAGVWKIEIDDGMGHGLVQEIEVSETMTLAEAAEPSGLTRYQKILIGVSIIFGITGIGFYLAGRKTDTPS